jgi:hypothetical protein
MALESNVDVGDIFAGEDKVMRFEVFAAGADPSDPHAAMQNAAGWTFAYTWRKRVRGVPPHRTNGPEVLSKPNAAITVTGVFNADRALNTQRVEVALADTDTADLAGGDYVDALKRMDDGFETVLSYGVVPLLVAATP